MCLLKFKFEPVDKKNIEKEILATLDLPDVVAALAVGNFVARLPCDVDDGGGRPKEVIADVRIFYKADEGGSVLILERMISSLFSPISEE